MRHPLAALTTAALLASVAAPALAQTDWSGPYFGAAVGYAKQKSQDNDAIRFDTNLDGTFGDTVAAGGGNAFSPGFCNGRAIGPTPGAGCSSKDDGLDFHLRGGYDWQFGNWVIGGVGEFGVSDVQDSVAAFSTTPASYSMTRDVHSILAGRVRAGYAVGDYLPYVTGGVARAKINNSFTSTNLVNTFVQRGDDSATGFQAGAGLERGFSSGVRVGLEYMFSRFDDDTARVRAQGPAPAANPFIQVNANGTDFRRAETDLDIHAVRATVSYAF